MGEVITAEEAERRGEAYDRDGATYLFDLDFVEEDSSVFTVDAGCYGNISHFFNHSVRTTPTYNNTQSLYVCGFAHILYMLCILLV